MTDEAKSPLTIRLTESAVFLRSDGADNREACDNDSRPSMLRGLLTLELAKPTRISSIELELVAVSVVSRPEGIGSRRVDVTEEHEVFRASTVYFRAGDSEARRNASIGPGAHYFDNGINQQITSSHQTEMNLKETANMGHDSTRGRHAGRRRRLSADNLFFQRSPLSQDEFPIAPTPPYSPPVTQPSSPILLPSTGVVENHLSRALAEFPDHFDADLPGRSRRSGLSLTRSPTRIHSLSRAPSIEDVPENEPSPSSTFRRSPVPSRSTSRPPSPSPDDNRGRRRSRLSFSSVLVDAMQSSPVRPHRFAESRDSSIEDERGHLRRGRPQEKGKAVERSSTPVSRPRESKERFTFGKLGALFKLDNSDNQAGDRWKEFKKGTYTYPISYVIPANSSPTMQCTNGSVTWRLRATVHRPGAFTSKLGATREVLVINDPTEGDNEEHGNIAIERQWDQQLQYLISVSGRSFHIGGTLTITFTFMPLEKVKIHQIHVFIEERVDYYTQMKRIARTDPLTRITLLNLRDPGKAPRAILPLESDDEDAFKNSPLFALAQAEGDPSEVAASYVGPGPWMLTSTLKLPTSCRRMHASNKNRRSNVVITHLLKCAIRVERGDDLHVDTKSGKRKLFDITAHIPIQILSCRCNPEWTSLPPYMESFDNGLSVTPKCPCEITQGSDACSTSAGIHRHPSTPERAAGGQPSTNSPGVESSSVIQNTLPHNDPLFNRSSQYERLISGQESEVGDAPPMYTPVEL